MTGVRGLAPEVAGVVRVTTELEGHQVVVLGVAETAGVAVGGGVRPLLVARHLGAHPEDFPDCNSSGGCADISANMAI